jgi:hypothetical protein
MKETVERIGFLALLALILLLLLHIGALLTHASAATVATQRNSLGAVISDINPNMYVLGRVVRGSLHECDKEEWCTTVEIVEYKSALLLPPPTMTFCGDEVKPINEATNKGVWVIFTYRRQGTRIYSGIVCHDLVNVISVKEVK